MCVNALVEALLQFYQAGTQRAKDATKVLFVLHAAVGLPNTRLVSFKCTSATNPTGRTCTNAAHLCMRVRGELILSIPPS